MRHEILYAAFLMIPGAALALQLAMEAEIPLTTRGTALVLTPDNRELFVAEPKNASVVRIATRTRTVAQELRVGLSPDSLAVSANGAHVYVGQSGGNVSIIDQVTNRVTPIQVGGPVWDLAVDEADRYLYLAMCRAGLKRLDLQTRTLETLYSRFCAWALTISPDQRFLWVNFQGAGPGGAWGHDALTRFDVHTGRIVVALTGFPNVGGRVRFTPDGLRVWADGGDACFALAYDHVGCAFVPAGVAHVIDAASDRLVGEVYDSAKMKFRSISPDGALATFVGTQLRFFNARTLQPLTSFREPISDCVFSNDNSRVYVTNDRRRSVQILTLHRGVP